MIQLIDFDEDKVELYHDMKDEQYVFSNKAILLRQKYDGIYFIILGQVGGTYVFLFVIISFCTKKIFK